MKKLQILALGSLLFLAFESCTKDTPVPNNSKKSAVKQQQSTPAEQPQTTPQDPPSCPHASHSGSEG
jgi:hypothetical protein